MGFRPSRPANAPPLSAALAVVGLALGGLLVGYRPTGGDPDCLYLPLKAELGRALRQGGLPFWSDRFGLGAPLAAESHVAAFYPPNWIFFRLLDAEPAYRLAMWLHMLALVGSTYGYARSLGITPWGGALSAVALALSGFMMSHACHEPFYGLLPYLTLALWLTERWMAAGGAARLAGLALALGAQLTLGHFQFQTWTAALVLLTAVWRARGGVGSWRRAGLAALAVAWGLSMAAVQLGLTAELIRLTGFARPARELADFALPPAHWAQLAFPRLFMGFRGGPRDVYWEHESTSPNEACLYVGTVPLVLAAVGWLARGDRALAPWRWLVPIGLALATMPRWWPEGFDLLLRLPVLGHFRAPGRYTLPTTLGLALLAGRGLDRAISAWRFRAGLILALILAAGATATALAWAARPDVRASLAGRHGTDFLLQAALAWAVGLAAVVAWRRFGQGRDRDRLAALPLLVAALELGYLFHHGTTPWGWPPRLPADSPVFSRLARERPVGLVEGPVHNLPVVSGGLTTAFPYLSIFPPPPNYLLRPPRRPQDQDLSQLAWLVRSGVTHGVFEGPLRSRPAKVLYLGPDPALDALVPSDVGKLGQPRVWRLERYEPAFPEARVARVARSATDWYALYPALCAPADADTVWYLDADRPPDPPGPRARSARVASWDGRAGVVEHDGTVDLVVRRTFYPGWTARLNDGPEAPVIPAEGGYQAVRLPGAGPTRVRLHYRPTHLPRLAALSLGATAAALAVLAITACLAARRPDASGSRSVSGQAES